MSNASRVGRNTIYLSVATILGTGVGVAYNIFLARILGVQRFGEFAFAISFITIFSTVVEFSLNTVTVRDVARDPGKAASYFANSILLKGLLFLVALVLAAVTAAVLDYTYNIRVLLFILMLSLLFDGITKCCDSLFTAAEQMQYPAVLAVTEKALFAALGFVGLHFWDSVIAVAVAYVAAHGIKQAVSVVILRFKVGLKPKGFDYGFVKNLAQTAFPFFGISIIAAMYANIDRLFLFSMGGTAAVGVYAAAYRLVSVPIHFSTSFHQAIFPLLSRHAGLPDKSRLIEVLESSMRYLTLAAVPVAIGTTVLAEPIMRLIYGPAYVSGTVALQILIWAYALEFFNPFLSRVLFVVERQRVVLAAAIAGTVLNIFLNIILIPLYSFVGAAIATLAAAGVIFVILYLSVHRLFPTLSIGVSVLKTALSGILMWIVLLSLEGMALLPLVLIGASVYFLSLLLTRAISLKDFTIIRRVAGIVEPAERR